MIENTPERQAEFEKLATDTLVAADHYDGTTESADQVLLPILIKLEEWFIQNIGDKNRAILDEVQAAVSRSIRGEQSEAITVTSMIDRAIDNLGSSAQPTEQPSQITSAFTGIEHRHSEQTILPPGEGGIINGEGEGHFDDPQFQPRLETLIRELNRFGVRTDEIITTDGTVEATAMRRVSYALLEIPRIWREILVCNQVGEAARVIKLPLGIETYHRLTKQELDHFPTPDSVVTIKVICRDVRIWAQEVIGHLFEDDDLKKRRRVDVNYFQQLRDSLKNSSSPAHWLNMKADEIAAFTYEGMNIPEIFTKLGLDQDLTGQLSLEDKHVAIGTVVFGFGSEELRSAFVSLQSKLAEQTGDSSHPKEEEKNDAPSVPLSIIAAVKKTFPTSAEFLRMTPSMMRVTTLGCRTWQEFYAAVGEGSDFREDFGRRVIVAAKIYGENDVILIPYLNELKELQLDPSSPLQTSGILWADAVRALYPTGEAWMRADFQMAASKQKTLPFPDEPKRELRLLITRWGFSYTQIKTWEEKVLFGAKLFPEDDPTIANAIKEIEELKKSANEPEGEVVNVWRQQIKAEYSSGEDWLSQSPYELDTNALPDFRSIAKSNAISRPAMRAKMSLNSDTDNDQTNTPAWLRSSPTPVPPTGYRATKKIAQRFDLHKNPGHDLVNLIEMGEKIYGSEDSALSNFIKLLEKEREFLPELQDNQEKWREEVQKRISSYEEWMELYAQKEFRFCFQIAGQPLRRLKTLLQISDPPFGEADAEHWGQQIFGLSSEDVRKIKEQTEARKKLERDKSKLRDKIIKRVKKKIESPFEWCCLTKTERAALEIEGKRLPDIVKIFDLKIDPIENDKDFFELGIKIYGDDLAFTEALKDLERANQE